MAKYDINYACGHGSYTEQLYGPHKERDRRLEWLEANKVCPECYKLKKQAEDAQASKIASINLVAGFEPILACEVSGQIEANKEALYALGYRWGDSTAGGLLGYLSTKAPKRALVLVAKIGSPEDAHAWIGARQSELSALGYAIEIALNPLDFEYLARILARRAGETKAKSAAVERLNEIKAADPRPSGSPLRARIAEIEKNTGQRWNGKIYGRPGKYNFYVANTQYAATDHEVAERERILFAQKEWDAKYADIINAAKGDK